MHVHARKLAALLVVVAVSLAGVGFAVVSFTNVNLRSNRVVGTNENAADKVTIYGNGVTFVSYEEPVELKEDTDTVQFYLPYGAFTDTLTVGGISVAKITTSEEYHPIVERGDIITVYTEDSVYHGKFLGWDAMLLLEVNNGTVMIPSGRITKIVLTEVVQTQGPKMLIEVSTDSPPGGYTLKVSYLMRGPTWKPTYFIDLETSYLECRANIDNVENWDNFTLALVSGGPHIVYRGPIIQPLYLQKGLSSSPLVTSTSYDEYHEYTYTSKLSFKKGTVVKLPLFNGTAGLRQEYFWLSGEVQNRYHINNTLSEPLAAGVVEFYRGETWAGEDDIPYTPVNAESITIANYAYDIKVTRTMTKAIDEYYYDFQAINLTIRNCKTVGIQILVQQDIDGYTLLVSLPLATRVGPTLSWTLDVNAGETATVYYEWEHHW